MENKLYLLSNANSSTMIFKDKDSLKATLKKIISETEERYKNTYNNRPEWIPRYISTFLAGVRVIECTESLVFEFGFPIGEISRYGAKVQHYRGGNFSEMVNDYQDKPVSRWQFTTTEAYNRAVVECDNFNTLLRNLSSDITEEFFEVKEEETVIRKTIKATVTKKSLKSFGKEVEVVDKRFQGTEELEKLRNSLERVTVSVPGWGTITMSPDSLGEFAVKPVTQTNKVYKLI